MYRGLKEVKDARVIYIDMNAFFASVEQQDRPSLRHRPLAVISHAGPKGTVLAASYEAKGFGVKTGLRMTEASLLCPEIITTDTTPGRYMQVHSQFMEILRELFGPEVQAKSIDEAALLVAPNWQTSETCWKLAFEIKRRFAAELGEYIRCSIGIAPNTLLAKVATDLQKPNGLVEINQENLEETLGKLKLTDLPGIAERNATRLFLRGIRTPLDLYNADPHELRRQFGIWGQQWWWRLHGFEADSIAPSLIKTMSHQHVLRKWESEKPRIVAILLKMADRLAYRLLKNKLQCTHCWISIGLVGLPNFQMERVFDAPLCRLPVLLKAFEELCETFPAHSPVPVRRITLGLSGITENPQAEQLSLFSGAIKESSLTQAVTTIRQKYGRESLQTGMFYLTKAHIAKEEVGFGHLKDREIPAKSAHSLWGHLN